MGGIRLRTKFLLSMVAVSAALTFTTLLVVRHAVQQEVRLGIQRDLENSVSAFHNFQKQREVTLERSAAFLAYQQRYEDGRRYLSSETHRRSV